MPAHCRDLWRADLGGVEGRRIVLLLHAATGPGPRGGGPGGDGDGAGVLDRPAERGPVLSSVENAGNLNRVWLRLIDDDVGKARKCHFAPVRHPAAGSSEIGKSFRRAPFDAADVRDDSAADLGSAIAGGLRASGSPGRKGSEEKKRLAVPPPSRSQQGTWARFWGNSRTLQLFIVPVGLSAESVGQESGSLSRRLLYTAEGWVRKWKSRKKQVLGIEETKDHEN